MAEWTELQLEEDKYTDAEAVSAMGAKGDANPLHHDIYTAPAARAFSATLTAFTMPKDVLTLVPFDGESYDTQGEFNITTHKYIPQVAGYYSIHLALVWNSIEDGSYFIIALCKNNSVKFYDRGVSGGTYICGGVASGILYMNGSTDYITSKGMHNNSADQSMRVANCSMSGIYIAT